METLSSGNEKKEHRGNVDLVRRRLLKLAVYSVPAMLTVTFLPVEKAFAEPNAEGSSPKSPTTSKTPKSPKEPKTPKSPKSPKTSTTSTTSSPKTPKSPKTDTKTQSSGTLTSGTIPPSSMPSDQNAASTSSVGGSNNLNGWQAWLEFLRRLGLLK